MGAPRCIKLLVNPSHFIKAWFGCRFIVATSIILLGGCRSSDVKIVPLHDGFGIGSKWIGLDSGPGAQLYYQAPNSKPVLIWPFMGLRNAPILFTNDMAFFIADVPDEQGRLGNGTYFVVQAPGPALDVSEDLIHIWAESNHLDFKKLKGHYLPLRLSSTNNGALVHYLCDPDVPQATFEVSWLQLSNLVQEVERTGKPRTVKKPHVIYLKRDLPP